MINLGVSLVAFKDIEEIKDFLGMVEEKSPLLRFGGFELSYNLPKEALSKLSFLRGKTISVHAPCPQTEFYPNLGSANVGILNDSLNVIRESAETAVEFGAKRVVLHPGYTLDIPVYSDFRKRNAMIGEIIKNENSFAFIRGDTFTRVEYSKTKDYQEHLAVSFDNLKLALNICRDIGVELAIENLNPRLTYLYQAPDDVLEAVSRVEGIGVCLDIGHLWITSLVYNLDFLSAVKRIADTGAVVSVHVHDNNSSLPAHLADEHLIPGHGVIPIVEALSILKERGVTDFIVEAVNDRSGEGLGFLTKFLK